LMQKLMSARYRDCVLRQAMLRDLEIFLVETFTSECNYVVVCSVQSTVLVALHITVLSVCTHVCMYVRPSVRPFDRVSFYLQHNQCYVQCTLPVL
jgi:hypothetical protein